MPEDVHFLERSYNRGHVHSVVIEREKSRNEKLLTYASKNLQIKEKSFVPVF